MRKEAILAVERVELQKIQFLPEVQDRLEKVARIVFQNSSILDMVEDDIDAQLMDESIVPSPDLWDGFFEELIYSDLRYFFGDGYVQMSGTSMVTMKIVAFGITPEAFISVERAMMQDAREEEA